MRILVSALVSTFSNWKTAIWFLICITRQRLPVISPDRVLIFLIKTNGSPSKMCISFEGRSGVSIFSMKSICWASGNPGQLDNGLMSWVKVDMMPNDWTSWVLHCCKWWLIWFTSLLVAQIQWRSRGKGSCGSRPSQKKSWVALISLVTDTWKRLWSSLQSWISFVSPFVTESKKVAHNGSGALIGCWIWNFEIGLQYGRRVMSGYVTGIEKTGTMGVIVADPQWRESVFHRIGFSHAQKLIEEPARLYLRPKVSTSIPHQW
jgi:hypothetical protein